MRKLLSDSELRLHLEAAFHEGRVRGKWETTSYLQKYGLADPEPRNFDDWYEDVYGGPDCE